MPSVNYRKYPVVILDDEESIMELLSEILRPKFDVRTTTQQDEFLDIIGQVDPSILIIDYHLQGITGLELIDKLPQLEAKIIIISGDRSRQVLEDAINEQKVQGFINKPFSIKGVLTKVSNYYEDFLEIKEIAQEHEQQKEQAEKYQEELSDVNETLFETLVTSHSNYRMADRLASLIDTQLEFVASRINPSSEKEHITEMLTDVKTLILSIHTHFSIDSVVILNSIIELLIKLTYKPSIGKINRLENNIDENLEAFSPTTRQSISSLLSYYLTNLKESIEKGEFNIIEAIENLSELNLANTLVNEYLESTELPKPRVHFILIINEDKPIFKYAEIIDYDLSLATNFIIALDSFSQEMLKHGSIKTIQLEKGVMMVRQREDISYCCLVDYETLEIRMRFESFINSTLDFIKTSSSDLSLDGNEFLIETIHNILISKSEE